MFFSVKIHQNLLFLPEIATDIVSTDPSLLDQFTDGFLHLDILLTKKKVINLISRNFTIKRIFINHNKVYTFFDEILIHLLNEIADDAKVQLWIRCHY